MKKYVDMLFDSMIKHDPWTLPFTKRYAVTENCRAAAPQFLNCWRTITGVNGVQHVFCDKTGGQLFFAANLDEHGMPAIVYGRMKIENEKISEIELSVLRSSGDTGFIFEPEEMLGPQHKGWTSPIPEGGKATREELLNVASAIFDRSKGNYAPASDDIPMMEAGGTVFENPDYFPMAVGGAKVEKKPPRKKEPMFHMGIDGIRPEDPDARIAVVDEEQGVVVVYATIDGYTCAHPSNGNETCFVPDQMMEGHGKVLIPGMFDGIPEFRSMRGSMESVEVIRFFSGKVQAGDRFLQLQGPGARSPWVTK